MESKRDRDSDIFNDSDHVIRHSRLKPGDLVKLRKEFARTNRLVSLRKLGYDSDHKTMKMISTYFVDELSDLFLFLHFVTYDDYDCSNRKKSWEVRNSFPFKSSPDKIISVFYNHKYGTVGSYENKDYVDFILVSRTNQS